MKRVTAPTTYEEKIEVLFDSTSRKFFEVRSSLTLLMEEARVNFKNQPQSIWSGAMCVMAGIDLVAKFYCDKDTGRVEDRFTMYLEKIMHLSTTDAQLIYHARNSLMHSFGLYSKGKSKAFFTHPRYEKEKWPPVIRIKKQDGLAEHFELGIESLFVRFENSLKELKIDLLENRRDNFSELFDKYGTDKPLFEGSNFYDYCNIHGLSKVRL